MSGSTEKYICGPQQRLMDVILALAGHEVEGRAPGDIAKAVGCAPSQTTRDLANLRLKGWAEQIAATGRWRLGPEIVQVSMRFMTQLDRAERRLEETRNRFTRQG